MPELHSRYFSASASSRWIQCPPSVIGEQMEQGDTSAADEGTMGHHFTETTLKARLFAYKRGMSWEQYTVRAHLGEQHAGWRLAENHIRPLQSYVDFVWGLVLAGGKLYIESQVDYSEPLNVAHLSKIFKAFGTADALIVMPDGVLWVIDLKFGMWDVDAEGNTQQGLYALGGWRSLQLLHDIKKFNFVIFQPRTKGRADDQWRTDFVWLEKMTKRTRKAAGKIVELVQLTKEGWPIPPGEFKPSAKACEFCRKAGCSARIKTWRK